MRCVSAGLLRFVILLAALTILVTTIPVVECLAKSATQEQPPPDLGSGLQTVDLSGIGRALILGEVLYGLALVTPSIVFMGLNAKDIAAGQKPRKGTRVGAYVFSSLSILGAIGFLYMEADRPASGPGEVAGFVLGVTGTAVGLAGIGLAIAGEFMPVRGGAPLPAVSVAPIKGGAVLGVSGRF
jgi:hypothetical protein